MRFVTIVAVTLLTTSAFAIDSEKEISDVEALRAELAQVRGGVVRMNGIDTTDALKKLTEALLALDRRLSTIEGKK